MDYIVPIVVVSLLITINGLFVAAEFAIAGSSRPRITHRAEAGSTTAQHVLDIISNPVRISEYLSTAQVGITIASLGLGMYAEPTIAHWLVPLLEAIGVRSEVAVHTLATVLTVGLLTYLHVVLGEMAPKSIALVSPDKAAIALYPFMALSQRLFGPLTSVLNWIGNGLLALLGMPQTNSETHSVTTEDLSYIVDESLESGLIEPSEQVFLENVIDFHERSLGQIMTPRNRMVAIPFSSSFESIMDQACNQRYSRFPVYVDTRDHIVGILHLKDLARSYLQHGDQLRLEEAMRDALFVPESLALDEMLAQFREASTQIAIVMDEYGGTAGLVTMEDLAEEIIGEIQDEYDEEVAPIVDIAPGRLRVRGDLLLDELDQHYDINLDIDEAETVGGLFMSKMGKVPKSGDVVDVAGMRLTVESVDGLAVNTAIIDLPNSSSPES